MVDWLAQNNVTDWRLVMPKSRSNRKSQVIYAEAKGTALYSASELDLKMVDCFLDFQLIGDCPNMMM